MLSARGLSDVGHSGQLLLRCRHQRVKRAERHRQHLGSLCADLPDAERTEQPREVVAFAGLDGLSQVLCRLFALSGQRHKRFKIQAVEISGIRDHLLLDERVNDRAAETVDVHGLARDKMRQIAAELRGTFRARAAQCHAVLVAHDRAPQTGQRLGSW